MADWRLAPTLVTLRSEVNRRWPLRDKTSDGTIGNTSHAAGTSDHNPDSRGVVCAIDLDEDVDRSTGPYPSFYPGQPLNQLLAELLASAKDGKLPQLYYLIYEGYIYSRTYGFAKRRYEGSNPHDHHMHISVYHTARLADSTEPWGIYPREEDMALTTEDLGKIRAMLLSDSFVQEFTEKQLTRDGIIPNVFSGNVNNPEVTMRGALVEIGLDLQRIQSAIESPAPPSA